MKIDNYGQPIYTETDLCWMLLRNPSREINGALVEDFITFPDELEITNIPNVTKYQPQTKTIDQFDKDNQSNILMPDEYKNMDIAEWVLNQCKTDAERQRVGEELFMFLDRDLFPLLCYLKYLVDTLQKNNIVWGVGRGSSVASYVLYLIGVHSINSIYWDIPISEFLKD